MYKIIFYQNTKGISDVENYINELRKNKNYKDNKIKLNKIIAYIDLLSQNGLSLGEPYIKHLGQNIWELRPLRDRILFASLDNNTFILLNVFMKKTQKTPQREIEKAKKLFDYYKNRS